MKISAAGTAPIITNGGTQTEFKVAANGKAFRVLSDTLYQNKIGSMIRETSCNAADAHVAAGKPETPFELHLPDQAEPWFAVKDYGIGLSPEAIENVFTVYFASTKDQSNDMIGAFGLGAKTPFAYTDSFTVTSIFNGVKTVYSAVVDENDVPRIVVMGSLETDECNGVEINVPVKKEDFARFREEAATQLRFFAVKPVVTNATNFEFKRMATADEIIYSSDMIQISNIEPKYGSDSIFIIQGGVGYPVNISTLSGKISDENYTFINDLKSTVAYLTFPIGKIGVIPSREAIEYDKRNIANIDAQLTAIRNALNDFIISQVSGFPTNWEKAAFLNKSPVLLRLANAAGVVLDGVTRASGAGVYLFKVDDLQYRDDTHVDANGKTWTDRRQWAFLRSYTRNQERRDLSPLTTLTPSRDDNVVIALRNTGGKPIMRLRNYFVNNPDVTRIIMFECEDEAKMGEDFAKVVAEHCGGFANIVLISDMPVPERERNASGGNGEKRDYVRPTYYRWRPGMDVRSSYHWTKGQDKLSEAFPDGGIYVTVERSNVTGWHYQLEGMPGIGVKLPHVIGMRAEDIEKHVKGNAKWETPESFVTRHLEAIKANPKLRQYGRRLAIRSALRDTFRDSDFNNAMAKHLTGETMLTRLLALYTSNEKAIEKMVKENGFLNQQIRIAEVEWSEMAIIPKLKKICDDTFASLPFLRAYVSNWQLKNQVPVEHLMDYINKFGPQV